ncbi:hypothetical protein VTG60DRAFT_6525 [Thermothelomyces hinnuleus]
MLLGAAGSLRPKRAVSGNWSPLDSVLYVCTCMPKHTGKVHYAVRHTQRPRLGCLRAAITMRKVGACRWGDRNVRGLGHPTRSFCWVRSSSPASPALAALIGVRRAVQGQSLRGGLLRVDKTEAPGARSCNNQLERRAKKKKMGSPGNALKLRSRPSERTPPLVQLVTSMRGSTETQTSAGGCKWATT